VSVGWCAGVAGVGDGGLCAVGDDGEAGQRRLDAVRFAVVSELDARDLPRRHSGLRTPGWYASTYGRSTGAAHRCVATARKMRAHLDVAWCALAAGDVSCEQVEVIARHANSRTVAVVAEIQAELLAMSVGVRFERWSDEIRALLQLADGDGVEPSPERNRASMADGLDGELHVELDLVGDAAAVFRAAVLDEADRRHRHHLRLRTADPDHVLPGRARLLAEAIVELARRGCGDRPNRPAPVTDVTLVINA